MTYEKLKCKCISEAPLIMHNGQMCRPDNPFSVALKKITGKRTKVDADHIEMSRLEFMGGLYIGLIDGKKQIVIPGDVIEATIVGAAKKSKEGKIAQAAIFCNDNFKLEYDGEQDYEKRFDDESCKLVVPVKIGTARIVRTRPKFNKWSCDIEVMFDSSKINREKVKDLLKIAGEIGFLDWRPKYGRFTVQF